MIIRFGSTRRLELLFNICSKRLLDLEQVLFRCRDHLAMFLHVWVTGFSDLSGRLCFYVRAHHAVFVPQESTLHLVLRLRGGAKKRKKKSYTTPKKNKHKRKKVKLAVLKYYKVDENGKIHRLRRECPADECGAGVFMASHFDRHYCGKCTLTYCFNKPEDK
ncbi:Ubiquitin-40S ribosomal protein S27a [Oryzias melastigma]|uniref:Ubiquitin-40S ribosomal protein S27a n=1 Tax=Oryzias melastigma TaxID=30732 RepID=A0A834CHH8_ORYME|nr:Ubiquitin-40S ribosomal protein S27a [Oryzias melastigma]